MVNDSGIVRYNLSRNDRNFGVTIACDPATNARVHNNTIYTTHPVDVVWNKWGNPKVATFSNNIFHGGAKLTDPGNTYDGNVYYGFTGGAIARDAHALTADPQLIAPYAGRDGLRLRATSPARGSGVAVPDNGGRDYWGHRVPTVAPPCRGAHER